MNPNNKETKILLFIPAYNCEKQIVRVLAQLDNEVQQYITAIIVVNNRSTDGTEKAVLRFAAEHPDLPLVLLRNDENYGLGGSHKVAFDYALDNGFEYVIVLHGDDQGSIKDIVPILSEGLYKQYDCCLGARFMKGSALPGYSRFRTFGNKVYNLLFSIVCGRRIYDLGSGLNLYSTKMLENKFYYKYPDNLTFDYCKVMALHCYRQSALFFPISWREDDQVSNVKLFSQATKTLSMLASYLFFRKKFF
jgi:glycosyltransferase involved in cell wall biosynthesis